MSKNLRTFKLRDSFEGCIIENNHLTHIDGMYYIKYSFGNDDYQTIYDSFTKTEEFSVEQIDNLETFYNDNTIINEVETNQQGFEKVYRNFFSFIDSKTLKYIDDIDAVYTLYIAVKPETAVAYSDLFTSSRVLEVNVSDFADYLYYSVYGRKVKYPELVVYEFFDVESFLATI